MPDLNPPRIRAPRSARAGEVVEIRTLVEHPMETGLRSEAGRLVPRGMLARMVVRLNGAVALEVDFRNGSAANPYHVFFLRIERASEVEVTCTDEQGSSVRAVARIALT